MSFKIPELAALYTARQEVSKPLQVVEVTMPSWYFPLQYTFDPYDEKINTTFLSRLRSKVVGRSARVARSGLGWCLSNAEQCLFRCFTRYSIQELNLSLVYLHQIGIEYDPTEIIAETMGDPLRPIDPFEDENLIYFPDFNFMEGIPAVYFLDGTGDAFNCVSVYFDQSGGLRHPIHDLIESQRNVPEGVPKVLPLTTMRDALVGTIIIRGK